MGKRALLFTALVLLLLVGGSAAVYAYDSGRENVIAKGVTAAGIDIGGMRRDAATQLLQRRLAEPLDRPIVVRAAGRRFRLSAQTAQVTTDVGGMVAEALAASRQGDIITRSWRGITGGKVHKAVALKMGYSSAAVESLVARVKQAVNRAPKDASVTATASGLQKVGSRTGVALRESYLTRRVQKALSTPGARRLIVARTKIDMPAVTTAELADKYPWYIVVRRGSFRLDVYDRLRLKKTYPIAVGQVGLETPAGLYHVQNKAINPAWHVPNSAWAGKLAGKVISGTDPTNPIKARWLGIFDGAGIHGTDVTSSLGSAASHGCIRMAIPDVIEVYDEVPVGAPVYIA
jgi:lipoprotein-anchoring transpeptidase ErfK/SrfK